MPNSVGSAQLQEARVTQVVNDVKLLLEQAAPRTATISDLVRHGTAVRTGTQSRSELTFSDLTITRLGANTIFSFKEGTREMTLIDGAILFQVPKGSGGATIRTVGVTAAITDPGSRPCCQYDESTRSDKDCQCDQSGCCRRRDACSLGGTNSVPNGPAAASNSEQVRDAVRHLFAYSLSGHEWNRYYNRSVD